MPQNSITPSNGQLPDFLLFGGARHTALPSFANFPTDAFTLAFRLNTTVAGPVFSYGERNDNGRPPELNFNLVVDDTLTFTFGFDLRFSVNAQWLRGQKINLKDGQDHQIAFVYETASTGGITVHLYVDGIMALIDYYSEGQLQSSNGKPGPANASIAGANPPYLRAGKALYFKTTAPDTTNDFPFDRNMLFGGSVSRFRIWAGARDDRTVAADANRDAQPGEQALRLAWEMRPGDIDFARDKILDGSGSHNDASILPIPGQDVCLAWTNSVPNFPTGEMTISLWLRCGSDSNGTTILNYSDWSNSDNPNGPPNLMIAYPESIQVGQSGSMESTGVNVADGKWHHLAFAFAGSGDDHRALTVFVDGAVKHTNPNFSWNSSFASGQILVLGNRYTDADDPTFLGMMRDVQVWKVAKDAQAVRRDALRVEPSDSRLAVWWTLDRADMKTSGSNLVCIDRAGRCEIMVFQAQRFPASWVDLTGMDLSSGAGFDLRSADLRFSILTSTNLTGQRLDGADLTGASLAGATLAQASFTGAALAGTRFDGCDLTTATFDAAPNFSRDPGFRTSFAKATLPAALIGTTWTALDLSGATLNGLPIQLNGLVADYAALAGLTLPEGTTAPSASFQHADLSGATLSNAILQAADFSFANLSGANMYQADVSKAKFVQTLMRNFHARRGNFEGADLSTAFADSTSADSAADFSQAYMKNAILDGAQLQNAVFNSVHLYGDKASLSRANLDSADFGSAILNGASMNGVQATNTNFQGTQMVNCVFDNATLKGTRFIGSYMMGTSFVNATLNNCYFQGSRFGKGDTTLGGTAQIKENNNGATYTLQWDDLSLAKVPFDQTCTCPDGGLGRCDTLTRFTPNQSQAPYPPVPDDGTMPWGGNIPNVPGS